MKRIQFAVGAAVLLLTAWPVRSGAQQASDKTNTATVAQTAPALTVPHLVKFSGNLKDATGKPMRGVAGVTFALYKEDQGGAALWIETQNVQLDGNGRYSVTLGATKVDGMDADVFASGEARWLGVQPEGQAEQPRVLLLSVPYALKAGDAETLGGKPASAFLQAIQSGGQTGTSANAPAGSGPQSSPTVHGSGTVNYLPIWTGSTLIGNSTLLEKSGNLGIGTTSPATTLDVNGAATIRGNATITGTLSTSGSLAAPSGGFSGNSTSPILNVTQAGTGAGISASTSSSSNTTAALYGTANASSGNTRGVIGLSSSSTGIGVEGGAGGFGSGTSTGVYGFSISSAGTGVAGSGWYGVTGAGNGVGGQFQASQTSALILKGLNSAGLNVFGVDGKGSLYAAGAAVAGNGLETVIGDPGCGGGTAAVAFSPSGFVPCTNYALRGDSGGNLYINSNSTGWMFFDHNNTGLMSLDPSGNLGVVGSIHSTGAPGTGIGISTDGNAAQARGAGGFIKAMAYVDPFAPGGIAVTRCYNSQTTGAAVTTPPCGMSISHLFQGGNYIDFGFEVDDRFVSLTLKANQAMAIDYDGNNSHQRFIATYLSYQQSQTVDTPFYVFVY